MRKSIIPLFVLIFAIFLNESASSQINCPGDLTFSGNSTLCGASLLLGADPFRQIAPNAISITYSFSDDIGSGTTTAFSGSGSLTIPFGEHIVTATALFVGGATASCTFKVTITGKEINSPGDLTFPGNSTLCGVSLYLGADPFRQIAPNANTITYSFSDDIGSGAATVSLSSSGSLTIPFGEHIVTATANFCDQSPLICTFKVTVTGKEINSPGDLTFPGNSTLCGVSLYLGADPFRQIAPNANTITYSFSDDIGSGAATVSLSVSGSLTIPFGEHIVTATANFCDQSPLICTFKVTVTGKEINSPGDLTFPGNSTICGVSLYLAADPFSQIAPNANTITYSFSDDIGSGAATVSLSGSGSLTIPFGEHIVTATANFCDQSPLICTFKVTVTGKEINCPGDLTFSGNSTLCGASPNLAADPFRQIAPNARSITYSFSDDTGSGTTTVDVIFPSGTMNIPFGEHIVTATANFCNQSPLICTFKVTVTGAPVPTITCPGDFTVFANPLTCNALVSFSGSHAALSPDATQIIYSYGGVSSTTSLFLPYGENIVTAKATIPCVGDKICTFKVTVAPNPQDIVFTCPGTVTVGCSKDVPAPDIRSVTLSYFCATFTVEYVGDIISNQTCANRYTVTRTYRVKEVPSVSCSQTINVFDNTPPIISNVSVSSSSLWPPNHKMQTVTVSYNVSDNCDATANLSVSSNQPINGTGDGDTSPDWVIVDAHHVQLRAERGNSSDGRIYTITITATDGCNASTTAITTVTVAHNITGPVTGTPFKVGSTVNFSGVFWDKKGNKHTGAWLINETSSVKGVVIEPSGTKNGKLTGSYRFGATGVYRLQMNVTDQNKVTSYANTNEDQEEIIVIYDPNGGYAYGGGNFVSPQGALMSNPSATGKVTYGFTVNYYKAASLPKGETHFNFNVGDFQYDALNFDYLAVAGYKAVFKGSGKIKGGQSGVNFIMYVIDGALDGSGVDKVRLKIYNKNTNHVYYDNEPGNSDASDPVTAVGFNSQVVISGISEEVTQIQKIVPENLALTSQLTVSVYPNPTQNHFALQVESSNQNDRIILQVFDLLGRMVETRPITRGLTDRIGSTYKPGSYLIRVIQGKDHQERKVLKLPN